MSDSDLKDGPAPGAFSSLIARVARMPVGAPDQPWAIRLHPGDRVGRYEITREIGRGGFGAVYEALDRELGRAVAVKTVRPGRALTSDGGAAWLHDEAEAIASLSHPAIVAVYDVGESDGAPYVVMELLRGETLEERLDRGPLPFQEAIRVARDVAAALAYAHGRGVIHRDLKPANVFLCEDGGAKLLDFGLAHVFGHGVRRDGGTPAYLAPERWRGDPEDARTDLFSLGVLVYEMLAGRKPYAASETRSAALDPGPPPPLAVPRVPRRLAALVTSAIAKDPEARPSSARAFLDEVVAVERRLERPYRWARTARTVAIVATLVTALLAGWVEWRRRSAPLTGDRLLAVAVADFTNETDEPDLGGLSGLVITSLEQSRRLQVLTRARLVDVIRQLGREDAPRIDEPLAREIGLRSGVSAVLLGSVRRFERTYSVELRALDPRADRYLFAIREESVGKESIPALVDRLSARARESLRERSSDVRSSAVKVADAVTPNLAAYQQYFLGLDCQERPSRYPDHPHECLEKLHRAVELDPSFALAWFQIALTGWDELLPAAEDRGHAIAEALRHADRVPPKERKLMRGWAAHLAGNDDEAMARYEEVIAEFPEDKQALYLAGDLAWHRDDQAAVAPYLGRVLKLDPTFDFALDHLSYSLAVLGMREELAEWVSTWSGMAPTPALLRALVRGHLGLGDAPAALAAARRGLALGPESYALHGLAWALSFAGDYATLEEELAARGSALPVNARYWLAHAQAAQGRRAEALRTLDAVAGDGADEATRRDVHIIRAVQLAGDDAAAIRAAAEALSRVDPRNAAHLATYLARLGDVERARPLAALLDPGSPSSELFLAVAEWKEGRHVEARARLDALEQRNPLPRGGIAPAFLRAEVAADAGLDAEAVDALRRFERVPFQPSWRSWAYPRSLLLLARSLERLGKREEARDEVERLVRLLSRADRGLPLLKEVQALESRLASPMGGARSGAKATSPPVGGSQPVIHRQ